MELLCGPIRAKSVQKIIHKRIGTYLRCQPHIHFLQVAWVDVGGCQLSHNFQLVVLLSLVELLVVIKADFVLTSLETIQNYKLKSNTKIMLPMFNFVTP